jgi:hypothetical protein
MDLDDLFGGDSRHRDEKNRRPSRDQDDYDRRDMQGFGRHKSERDEYDHHDRDEFDLERITQWALAHKKFLVIGGGILVLILLLAVILLLPLIGQAFDTLNKGGVKAVVERIWQGSGK